MSDDLRVEGDKIFRRCSRCQQFYQQGKGRYEGKSVGDRFVCNNCITPDENPFKVHWP